jgi:hypothetical protein
MTFRLTMTTLATTMKNAMLRTTRNRNIMPSI